MPRQALEVDATVVGSGPPLQDLTPEELLARYVGGDDLAFHVLVEVVGERLFGFLVRFLGDHHRAEDVYQQVWIKVATHAASFDGRARFTTWLYSIARNASLDALRSLGRDRLVQAPEGEDGDSFLAQVMGRDLPPDEVLSVEELGRRIGEAVMHLPEEQREVFLLREDADLTFDEIGQLLGCGRETAKSRMRYALSRLQAALGSEARLYGLMERL